jgi:hypothetical protein
MKWTTERVDAVRTLAASGSSQSETAAKCGVSAGTIAGIASRNHIHFGQPKLTMPPPESRQFMNAVHELVTAERDAIRARWLAEMPRLRDNVKAEVERIMTEDPDTGDAMVERIEAR